MVEHTETLDSIFQSLSDSTRRDILRRVSKRSSNIGDIAKHYELSFAGVAKHLAVLERAGLISKTKIGKEQIVAIVPDAFAAPARIVESYRNLWEARLDSLESHLKSVTKHSKK